MIDFLKEVIIKLGVLILPAFFLLPNQYANLNPLPKLPTPTIQPSLTPTNTPTPIPTPTPEPTPTIIPTAIPTLTTTPIPISSDQLNNWFTQYSNLYSINKDKLISIAYCESKFNPAAQNGDYAGLFQFASITWQSTRQTMNIDQALDLRYDPQEAIKTAAFKISTDGLSPWRNCIR